MHVNATAEPAHHIAIAVVPNNVRLIQVQGLINTPPEGLLVSTGDSAQSLLEAVCAQYKLIAAK